ncbi:MAG: SLC13 family permease [Planctomycetota bacterium]
MESAPESPTRGPLSRLLPGVVLALLVPFMPWVSDLPYAARATAGIAFFTAYCWIREALPLPIASLMPALLFPALGVVDAREVAPWYFKDILLLFLGGFILALALERYGLHHRFALRSLRIFGTRPRRVVLGFMFVGGFMSMFISNTSTALLMLPVAVSLLQQCTAEEQKRLNAPLLLGIAYACSIGGVATPIGTAPNSVLLGMYAERFPTAPELSFGTWFFGAFPFVIVFLLVAWFCLCRVTGKLSSVRTASLDRFVEERAGQVKRTPEQNRVLFVFGLVALLWMTRQGIDFGEFRLPGWSGLLPEKVAATLKDSTVALFGVLLLFSIPGRAKQTGALMDWDDCKRIPWGILLLLGGGFALASGFEVSGLSAAVGDALGSSLQVLPLWGTVFCVVLAVTFLTEITSNTATINILLPVLFSASVAAGLHPMALAIPLTFAVSCAFMLPVATPPNAILFSSGRLKMGEMAKAGLVLNLCTAVLVTLFCLYWVAPQWGFDLSQNPSWAEPEQP